MEAVQCATCADENPSSSYRDSPVLPEVPHNTPSISSVTSQRGSPFDTPTSRISGADEVSMPLPRVDNCPICQSVPIAPRKLSPCGHVMCELCWVELFQHDSYDAQCPVCRASIEQTEADAALEFKCRMVYSEAVYKKRCDQNREAIVHAALEPAAQRPPKEVLEREYVDAQAHYQARMKEYDAAQKKLMWLRRGMAVVPIAETMCALSIVAMSSGWERWLVCLLITLGWWMHKMEHYVPEQINALNRLDHPERRPIVAAEPIYGRRENRRVQAHRQRREVMPSLQPIGVGRSHNDTVIHDMAY